VRSHNEVDGYSGPEAELTNRWLREAGGDCFMGFPTYRLVYTAKLTDLSGGEWCDWDESIPPDQRGSLVMGLYGTVVPDSKEMRRVTEMRRVEKYPEFHATPGWVIERWMAPLYWGTRESWERHKVDGTDIPKLGPYPHQGRYMLIGGPYPEKPTGPFLGRLIEYWEAMRDEVLAYEAATYVRKRVFEAEERDAAKNERWRNDAHKANMTCLTPFFSTTLEAGRARQLAVEHAGINSHYGN
jgi:hypothetical protein